jgi:alpha/beta superfamily hydrolase
MSISTASPNQNDTPPERLVVFAHGKESGPWGTKITHLAAVAKQRGFAVLSPDYSFTHDPKARVEHLLQLAPRARQSLVLVGSSLGGYVSAMACAALQPRALFLMAPALYFPGWDDEPEGVPSLTSVVHGWKDDIVPVERGQRFAARHQAALHLVDSGHTLNDQLPLLALLFDELLRQAS